MRRKSKALKDIYSCPDPSIHRPNSFYVLKDHRTGTTRTYFRPLLLPRCILSTAAYRNRKSHPTPFPPFSAFSLSLSLSSSSYTQ